IFRSRREKAITYSQCACCTTRPQVHELWAYVQLFSARIAVIPWAFSSDSVSLHMQGKHTYQPKLFVSVTLDDLVPQDNFYRQLNATLDLRFLYPETRAYYGHKGQASIDPVVFF